MSAPAFGLYAAPACAPGQKLGAGAALDLMTPVSSQGVTLFRRSLWLPVPAAARQASALALTGGALGVRFAPADIPVETGDEAWFTRVDTAANQTVRLDLTWPAPLRRIHVPAGISAVGFDLYRIDGENVADDPSQSGTTGANLNPPWIGSPLQIKLAHPIFPRFKKDRERPLKQKGGQPRAAGAGGPVASQPGGPVGLEVQALLDLVSQSDIIPSVTLAGRPTSPRLKLFLESPGAERLLWQALLPGEQSGPVTLPAQAVASEWAPALEQVLKALGENPAATGARLRVDVESDAPCAVTLVHADLPLAARYELPATPPRLTFDGSQTQTLAVELGPLPAGVPVGLTLRGRLDDKGGAAPDTAGDAAPPRQGVLLGSEQTVVLKVELATPASLAGLAIHWHPLSETLAGRLAVLADGGNGPGRELLQVDVTAAPTAPGWLALRWPALDLQAQALWLRLTLTEGLGLWLADPAGMPPAGWQAPSASPSAGTPLALAPAYQWLSAITNASAAGEPEILIGGSALQPTLEASRLSLALPSSLLPLLATTPIAVRAARPLSLNLEAAEYSALL